MARRAAEPSASSALRTAGAVSTPRIAATSPGMAARVAPSVAGASAAFARTQRSASSTRLAASGCLGQRLMPVTKHSFNVTV
jgi:hypothetical protein